MKNMETIFELIANDPKLREGLKFITDLAKEVASLRIENDNIDIALEQKDEEIKELWAKIEKLQEKD